MLQKLGLKQYEAACFVALSRLPHATAKEISEISDVPRTRVYDAVGVLESKGLVETHHASPKQFRVIPVDDATDVLRSEYQSTTETLRETLQSIDPVDTDTESTPSAEVWSLTGSDAIETRTRRLAEEADHEVVLVVGDSLVLTDALEETLRTAQRRGVSVTVGTYNGAQHDSLDSSGIETSSLDIPIFARAVAPDESSEISRILLVDRDAVLISSKPTDDGDDASERAVVGRGSTNGFVTIVCRTLLATIPPEFSDTAFGQVSQS
ncbi:TrmB family transcriptional regulator (plasmid) [Haloplanus rubicundus]|uniref:TrmB family transcriptional regulator n=1 Tax=Haloplanus rubicundus TaxID=1547898 RepID=A0A345E837_9EURY|nr:TrmB family transcriptional regulator [Haloplanus rubicundus]